MLVSAEPGEPGAVAADREVVAVQPEAPTGDNARGAVARASEPDGPAAPLIQELRCRASAIAREELERTLRRLGEDPELATRLDAMAGSIVSKILHGPSTRLREAAAVGGDGEALLEAAARIFGLPAGSVMRRTNPA